MKGPKKKVAVLVQQRQTEAFRMAVGLALMDDEITVYVMDKPIEHEDAISEALEALSAMSGKVMTNIQGGKFEYISDHDLALSLLDFDTVIPY